MKLLSRKPVKKVIDPVTGMEKLAVEDDDDDDDKKPQLPTAAEIEEKRKQKERDYEERRAKLFGTPPVETTSGRSTPGTTTPPLVGDNNGRGSYRGRGRGRGGRGGRGGQRNDNYRNEPKNDSFKNQSRTTSSERRPENSNSASPYRELFDPDASSRPGPARPQHGRTTSSPTRETPIRAPRGPDSTGARGFNPSSRGNKEG